jgi:hypothetical protein
MQRNPIVGFLKIGWKIQTSFLDLLSPHVPEKAQNGVLGPIQAYSLCSPVPVTGLIGALLITNFQIIDILA